MTETAIVIIDAHKEDLTDTKVSNMNQLIRRAEENGEAVFYVLPYGNSINSDVFTPPTYSILQYSSGDNAYTAARIDEQITGRDIANVQFYSPNSKAGDFANKERERGRSSYAGPPDHSNAPDWAGPPDHAGPPDKGGPPDHSNGRGNRKT
jgi:hypothetical protein